MTPYQPLVVQTGDTLRSANQYKSYQWYNESGMIAGATGRTYVISKSWKYHLVITDEIGCTNTSESISAIWSDAKITESGEFRYSIIPNPNRGQFIFRIDSGSGNEITLHLFNPLGQTIETRRMKQAGCNHSEQFDVSYLSKGMYYLVISAEKMIRTEKIVFH
jgi:hypothetical protein